MFTFDKKLFTRQFQSSTSKKIDTELLVDLFETIFEQLNDLERENESLSDRLFYAERGHHIDD